MSRSTLHHRSLRAPPSRRPRRPPVRHAPDVHDARRPVVASAASSVHSSERRPSRRAGFACPVVPARECLMTVTSATLPATSQRLAACADAHPSPARRPALRRVADALALATCSGDQLAACVGEALAVAGDRPAPRRANRGDHGRRGGRLGLHRRAAGRAAPAPPRRHARPGELRAARRRARGRAPAAAAHRASRFVAPAEVGGVDVAFVCAPHGQAAHVVSRLLDDGARVVDLSADFRLDAATYADWYRPHPYPELLPRRRLRPDRAAPPRDRRRRRLSPTRAATRRRRCSPWRRSRRWGSSTS